MKLAIFDIDGTLTCTNAIDEACFLETAQIIISPKIKTIDPEGFKHYTDENIVTEWYQQYFHRKPTFMEKEAFLIYFLQLLNSNRRQFPKAFTAVSGAAEILHQLGPDWQVALATGCWVQSAEYKLKVAKINLQEIPLTTSSEALSRHEIIKIAIQKAKAKAGVDEFEHIVYIGDGIWDLRTCIDLDLPFVGIEAEGNLEKQAKLGAYFLLHDYTNLETFIEFLSTAQAPILEDPTDEIQ